MCLWPKMLHAVAIAALASRQHRAATAVLAVGTVLFSGSLYLLALRPQWKRVLGPITPVGEIFLAIGWLGVVLL